MSDRCICCGHRYGYYQCPPNKNSKPPRDANWPPPNVRDIVKAENRWRTETKAEEQRELAARLPLGDKVVKL